MKIAIIGGDGQAGYDLQAAGKSHEVMALTHAQIEVSNLTSCRQILELLKPDVVINTAAYHQTDVAENEPLAAFQVNVFGARNVALVCREIGAKLVHISTDYVFHGDQKAPYLETDSPCPISGYGISKYAGEQFVRYLLGDRRLIIRTSGLFGIRGCKAKGGKNFVENVLEWAKTRKAISIVNDQRFSPTHTKDLAAMIFRLIQKGVHGTIHVTNRGDCTWYEFAQEILVAVREAGVLSETVSIQDRSAGNLSSRPAGTSPLPPISPSPHLLPPLRPSSVATGRFPAALPEQLPETGLVLSPVTTSALGAPANRPLFSVLGHGRLQELGMDDPPTWQDALREYLAIRNSVLGIRPAGVASSS